MRYRIMIDGNQAPGVYRTRIRAKVAVKWWTILGFEPQVEAFKPEKKRRTRV